MALLAIDQGNTRTKFGLFSEGSLQRTWVHPTDKSATPATLAMQAFSSFVVSSPVTIGLCTVVPDLIPAWRQMAEQKADAFTVISGDFPTPLRNGYKTPTTLGPDRLMTAVAAADRVGTPVIPISLGTAMVVDAVSADRAYLGGMIAPGIDVLIQSLATSASALWAIDWHEPNSPIGDTSEEAMASGIFHQSIGGLRNMVSMIRKEIGTDAPLALTGGWAQKCAPYLDHVAIVDAFLVLHGIAVCLREASFSH